MASEYLSSNKRRKTRGEEGLYPLGYRWFAKMKNKNIDSLVKLTEGWCLGAVPCKSKRVKGNRDGKKSNLWKNNIYFNNKH